MALNLIGLGLNNEKDITIKGLEIVKKCNKVYLENYTSTLNCSKEDLEKFYNKKIVLADRKLVEKGEEILKEAKDSEVALLIVGDIFSATTHIDLMLRAKKLGIKVNLIHNASILNAVSSLGLSLYKFGKITSIPFENEKVETPYDIIKNNKKINAHTLILLDLNPEESKFMTINEAINYLKKTELKRNEKVFTDTTLVIACSRMQSKDQIIKFGTTKEILSYSIKKYPSCLIIPSKLHFMEEEAMEEWK